jgi:hypothetical protein
MLGQSAKLATTSADKFSPSRGFLSLGSAWQASALENIPYGLITDLIAQLSQGTGNAVITPAAILLGHLHDPVFNRFVDPRSSHGLSRLRPEFDTS